MALPFLGFRKRQPVLCLFVLLRYCFIANTGHILLTCPFEPTRVLISLCSILFLRPFLARKEEYGLMSNEPLSLKEEYSSSLTQACTSLILQPVASRRRKAVFLREIVSDKLTIFSKSVSTLFRLHWGFGEGSCGLLILMPLSKNCICGQFRFT